MSDETPPSPQRLLAVRIVGIESGQVVFIQRSVDTGVVISTSYFSATEARDLGSLFLQMSDILDPTQPRNTVLS